MIIKKNEHLKEIPTSNLIVLCEVIEDYKSFCDDLEKLIKSNSNRNLVSKVYRIMQGNLSIISSKYKEFIEKHKNTIEIMKRYSCLSDLTVLSYDEKGNRRENLSEDYFYKYIQEHKQDIEKIKAVALKINSLGIDKISFDEELDFTLYEYKYDSSYKRDFSLLENMEVNPTYLNSPIRYKTNGSCYCLNLSVYGFGENVKLGEYGRNIELNSLIFDPNRLPNGITIESTINVIKKLLENKKSEHEDIRDSVYFSVNTSDLTSYFEHFKDVSGKINKIKDNPELVNLMSQIQNRLMQLQLFGENFENQIIDSYQDVTSETMETEKNLYLDIRSWTGTN